MSVNAARFASLPNKWNSILIGFAFALIIRIGGYYGSETDTERDS